MASDDVRTKADRTWGYLAFEQNVSPESTEALKTCTVCGKVAFYRIVTKRRGSFTQAGYCRTHRPETSYSPTDPMPDKAGVSRRYRP